MKLSIKAGATSQSVNVFIRDSSSTTGGGLAAVAPAGGSLLTGTKLYYSFSGANASAGVAVSLAVLAAVNSAWSSAGIVTLDATNMIGWVRIDIPDAALATSKGRSVSFLLFGGTNMAPTPFEIELTGWDNQDAVHGGMSAIPNTACTTNASLLTSGTGTDQLSVSAGKVLLQATQSGVTIPTVTTVTNQLTAAAIATGVWQDATSGDFTVASSIGKSLYTAGVVPGAASGLLIAGSNAATTFASGSHFIGTVDTVTTVTNQLTAAAIATGVWQDATAGDFTTASSIGKSLYTSGNAPGAASGLALVGSNVGTATSVSGAVGSVTGNVGGNVVGSVASVTGNVGGAVVGTVGGVTGLTTATIATAVWTDTTASDFTTLTSPGKIIFAQLGNAFTTTSSSIYTVASLANAPTGGSAPTTAQIATAVWEDLLAGGDFGTAGSIGKLLADNVDATISSRLATSGYTTPPTAAAITTAVWTSLTAGSNFQTAGSVGALLVADLNIALTTINNNVLALPSASTIASTLLKFDASTITGEATHSPLNALRKLRNRWAISGTTLTVYKEDASSTAYTQTLTATAGANPVTAISD